MTQYLALTGSAYDEEAPSVVVEKPVHLVPGTCNAWSRALIGDITVLGEHGGRLDYELIQGDSPFVLLFVGSALLIDGHAVLTRGLSTPPPSLLMLRPEPARTIRRRPPVGDLFSDVREWTGWSLRKAALVLGTTHPTVSRLANSETSPRSSAAIESLRAVHGVLERLAAVAPTITDLRAALLARESTSQDTVEDLFTKGSYAAAYRLALMTISGDHPEMLGGSPTRHKDATYPTDSDDWV